MTRVRVIVISSAKQAPAWLATLTECAEIELLATCGFEDGISQVRSLKPDVVVLNSAAGVISLELPRRLKEGRIALQAVIVNRVEDVAAQQHSLDGDTDICVTTATADLPRIVCELLAKDGLSDRERDVLRLIARGYTNKEIATHLDLSVKTVEKYKMRSQEKLSLRSRAEVVQYAINRGWLID